MQPAIGFGARRLPRAEHRADRAPQLLPHIFWERAPGIFLHPFAKQPRNALQIAGIQIRIELDTLGFLFGFEDLLEQAVLEPEHDIGVHLDEAAV